MSQRSDLRELRRREDWDFRMIGKILRANAELFRRSDAELDLHDQQARINAAAGDVLDAQDEVNAALLAELSRQDEVNAALLAELSRQDEDTKALAHRIGNDVRDLRARVDALEAGDGVLADPLQGARYAIARRLVIQFKYRDREDVPSYRVVSPYEIRDVTPVNGPPFKSLVAWDHGREGMRQLRIGRIEGPITITTIEPYREENA